MYYKWLKMDWPYSSTSSFHFDLRHVEGIKQHCNERSPVLYSVLQAAPTNCSEYKHHNTPKEKYTVKSRQNIIFPQTVNIRLGLFHY